jgi:hypothetical protein
LIGAFRAGAYNALNGTWIEDIDANNITQVVLQALVYDKVTFREKVKKKSSRHTGSFALAAEDATSLQSLIADGVAKALAALLPDTRRSASRNGSAQPSAERTSLKCWYFDKFNHRRRDCKQSLRGIRAGPQPATSNHDPALSLCPRLLSRFLLG